MHRTEADGNSSGLYTEGDAALGVLATVFSSSAANSFQEEIVNVVTNAGLPLQTRATDTFNQMVAAIKILVENGGSVAPSVIAIGNNQVSQDVTGIELDGTKLKSASYNMTIVRNTDTNQVVEAGRLLFAYEPSQGVWLVETSTSFIDAGISFEMVPTTTGKAKLTYSTNDLAGTSYFGELTLSRYQEMRV